MKIVLNNVTYEYGNNGGDSGNRKKALDNVNITVNEGDFIGLIGRTGSGKSTLIQHLNGLLKATSGRIEVDGKNIYDEDYKLVELRKKVGLVFQYPEYQLFEETVLKDVEFGPKNLGIEGDELEKTAKEALEATGLDEKIYSASPFELSGGQKRRVAIAGILAMRPKVMILDEPTAGLDPGGRNEILGLIKKLHDEQKITIILVSHSMEDVAEYVSRLIVMEDGRVKYDSTPREVFKNIKELEKSGLAAPEVSYIMSELKQAGLEVKAEAITIEEAKNEILSALRKK